jgi:hypothetical protein
MNPSFCRKKAGTASLIALDAALVLQYMHSFLDKV